jgi:hypothetical protein
VNGTLIGGEHLKLILLSAMFSLSILVRMFSVGAKINYVIKCNKRRLTIMV